MDPRQTLADAWTSHYAGFDDDANEHLASYWEWRRKGGFEPTWEKTRNGMTRIYKGDRSAMLLEEALVVYPA